MKPNWMIILASVVAIAAAFSVGMLEGASKAHQDFQVAEERAR